MSRRRHVVQVDTFPFLAVLLCTMGSLMLVLMFVDRRARVVARARIDKQVQQAADENSAAERARKEEWERRRQALHDLLSQQLEELRSQQFKVGEQAADAQRKAATTKEKTDAERRRIAGERAALARARSELQGLSAAVTEDVKQTEAGREKLRRLTLDLVSLENTLANIKALRSRQQETYSLVPYRGKHGDNRRPIYVECSRRIVFHPGQQAFDLTERTLMPVREEVQRRYAKQLEELKPGEKENTPYLLILLRPSGIENYYLLQQALEGVKIDFGYEFVDEDWVLNFPGDENQPFTPQPWMSARGPLGTVQKPAAGPQTAMVAPGGATTGRGGVPGSPPGSGPGGGATGIPSAVPGSGSSGPGWGGGPGGVPGMRPRGMRGGMPGTGFGFAGGSSNSTPEGARPSPLAGATETSQGSSSGATLGSPTVQGQPGTGNGNGVAGTGLGYGIGRANGDPSGGHSGGLAAFPGAPGAGPGSVNGAFPSGTPPGGSPVNGRGGNSAGPLNAINGPGGPSGAGNGSGPGVGIGYGPGTGGNAGTVPGGTGSVPATGPGGNATGPGGVSGNLSQSPGAVAMGTAPGNGSSAGNGFGSAGGTSNNSAITGSGSGGTAETSGAANGVASSGTTGTGNGNGAGSGSVPGNGTGNPQGGIPGSGNGGSPSSGGGAPGTGVGNTQASGTAGAGNGTSTGQGLPGSPGNGNNGSNSGTSPNGVPSGATGGGATNGNTGQSPPTGSPQSGQPTVNVGSSRPARQGGGSSAGASGGGTPGGDDSEEPVGEPDILPNHSRGNGSPLGAPPPRPVIRGPARTPQPARVGAGGDWIIPVECTVDAVVFPSLGERFAIAQLPVEPGPRNPLAESLRRAIDRRQATVRPGETAYKPQIRFQVHPDGLRAYYLAYPALELLHLPMTREFLENVKEKP